MSQQPVTVILASQSPQRKAIMDTLRIPYVVMPAGIDELAIVGEDQSARAALVAKAKGQAIRDRVKQTGNKNGRILILAADTYIVDPQTNTALEKPTSIAEARDMLLHQSGKQLIEHTGVYWYDSGDAENSTNSEGNASEVSTTITTKVTFRELSAQEIEHYIQNEPVTTWSGAFCPAYPTGAALIAHIDGSFTGFTHGFPLDFFVPKLRAAGISF